MNELNEFLKTVSEAKTQSIKVQAVKHVKENLDVDLASIFSQLTRPITQNELSIISEEVEEEIQERIVEETQIATPVDRVQQYLNQIEKDTSVKVESTSISPELRAIQDKLKYLEQWVTRSSATIAGGGAAEIYNLEMPSRVVSTDYVINRKDYYIGVNGDTKIEITLPVEGRNLKNGRVVIIKDESGHAQLTPIKIIGTIDNDPSGAEIRINNGALQLIYRNNSWRVV